MCGSCSQGSMHRTQSNTSSLMSGSSNFSPTPSPSQGHSRGVGASGETFDGSAELQMNGNALAAETARITRVEVACGDFVFALKVTYASGKMLRHGESPLDCRKLRWAQRWRSRTGSYEPSRFENAKWKGFNLAKVRSLLYTYRKTHASASWRRSTDDR